MKVRIIMLLLAFAAAVALVPAAGAFDRQPVRISGATADGYGATISVAEKKVRTRYPHAKSIRCSGALITGQSSWMYGIFRTWDKLYCTVGTVSRTQGVKLIFDVKGADGGFLLYRVKPWMAPGSSVTTPATRPVSSATSSSAGSVTSIRQGDLDITKGVTASVNSDRSVTVNWHLDTDTDATAYFDLWWSSTAGRCTSTATANGGGRSCAPRGSRRAHTIEVTTENMVWTDHYYSTGDCEG